MRKVIKTVMMAAFTAIAMSASAASVQTYSASSDSVLTQPVDTLSEKLAQMENRVNTLEKEQNYTKVWKRKKYWKFGITQPNLERTDGEAMTWKTNGSFFVQQGRTAYLHAKPIAGLIKIGIDYGFFDFTYTKLKLNEMAAGSRPAHALLTASTTSSAASPTAIRLYSLATSTSVCTSSTTAYTLVRALA